MSTTHSLSDRSAPLPSRPELERTASTEDGPVGDRGPRTTLRNVLLALTSLAAVAVAIFLTQMVWIAVLPPILLLMSPRGATRVLLGFVAVLVVIGGAVTTYRAGLAVPDYPGTFNQNMWVYDLEKMIEEGAGVSLEHTHRLWASALGLVSIFVLISCFIHRSAKSLTIVAAATLVAISLQGILGGTRVLERSQNLAFLHGVLAQAVVALIAVLTVMASRTWRRTSPSPSAFARGAFVLGPWVAGLVMAQIALGAWLRHQGDTIALLVHMSLALAVVAMVLVLAKQLSVAAQEGVERGVARRPLARCANVLIGSLIAQVILGIAATVGIYFISGGMEEKVSVGEAVFATAHVFVGSVLFCSTVIGGLYARRSLLPESA